MDFRGFLVMEVRPRGAGEGNSVKDLTYRRDPLCEICGEGSMWGMVGGGCCWSANERDVIT